MRPIAAPTGIQNAGSASPLTSPANYSTPAVNSADSSPLAAFAQMLPPRNQTSVAAAAPILNSADDQNLQGRKDVFLARARSAATDDYLKSTRTPPLSEYEVRAAWQIPAVLEQAIDSDRPGDVKALVTANVYDTATGHHLLIPQGSRLIGTYDSAVAYGQDGLQAVWNRIIFPDASSSDLNGIVEQDARGASAFRQDVDNHYKRLVGFSVLSNAFSAGFQLSQNRRGRILQYPSPLKSRPVLSVKKSVERERKSPEKT